jgi:hypothetical protein
MHWRIEEIDHANRRRGVCSGSQEVSIAAQHLHRRPHQNHLLRVASNCIASFAAVGPHVVGTEVGAVPLVSEPRDVDPLDDARSASD